MVTLFIIITSRSVQYSHNLDFSVIYRYCVYYLLILYVFITDIPQACHTSFKGP